MVRLLPRSSEIFLDILSTVMSKIVQIDFWIPRMTRFTTGGRELQDVRHKNSNGAGG